MVCIKKKKEKKKEDSDQPLLRISGELCVAYHKWSHTQAQGVINYLFLMKELLWYSTTQREVLKGKRQRLRKS